MSRRSAAGLAVLTAALLAVPAARAQTTPVTPRPVDAPPRAAACRAVPPTPELVGALGVLRGAATLEDTLPADVLRVLRARGLAPADPGGARLLRTTPDGGKAWIVPVPCVGPRRTEGIAVVAQGGAPAGGGAPLADLVRGRGDVSVDVCAGPGRDMLGVSGVVPDGVGAAYLTAPDGTAVRADVVDNGYSFVVPGGRDGGQRYVVWTGGDGTPHVQPVPRVVLPRRSAACRIPPGLVRVTPEPALCRVAAVVVRPPVPRVPRVPQRRRARPVPVPMPVPVPTATPAVPCAMPVPVPAPTAVPPSEPAPAPRPVVPTP